MDTLHLTTPILNKPAARTSGAGTFTPLYEINVFGADSIR